MACTQHTETRPKFTWLFLGTPAGEDFTDAPVTLRAEADDEQTARANFPAWELTFAAKIRTDCPVITSWVSGFERCFAWTIIAREHDPEELARHFESRKGGFHA